MSHNYIWHGSPLSYLESFGVTHVYIMRLEKDNTIVSIAYVDMCGEDSFFNNFTYDPKYKEMKVSPGMILYYYIISDLIKRNVKKFYLLGGNYDYKKLYNGIETMTYSCLIYRDFSKIRKILKFFKLYFSNCFK
jgi:CelD/BcsL family acetyltransferase involved in cellulose biosynthesis